jgi:hypothetical protein
MDSFYHGFKNELAQAGSNDPGYKKIDDTSYDSRNPYHG